MPKVFSKDIIPNCKLANISLGWVIDEAAFLPLPMWFPHSDCTLYIAKCTQHIHNTHFSYNAVSQNPHFVYSQITHCNMHTTHYNTHCTLIYFLLQCGFKLFTAQCHTTFKRAHLHLIHILILEYACLFVCVSLCPCITKRPQGPHTVYRLTHYPQANALSTG